MKPRFRYKAKRLPRNHRHWGIWDHVDERFLTDNAPHGTDVFLTYTNPDEAADVVSSMNEDYHEDPNRNSVA